MTTTSGGVQARRRRGFTLIETALTTIIVGVGVLAIVSAQQAFHKKNSWSSHASIAMQLGNEIREMTLNLPRHDPVYGTEFWGPEPSELFIGDFDDIDDFDGWIFTSIPDENNPVNGPINARREIIANMANWQQVISVRAVDPFDITQAPEDGSTALLMVEVRVSYQTPGSDTPEEITTVSWIAPN